MSQSNYDDGMEDFCDRLILNLQELNSKLLELEQELMQLQNLTVHPGGGESHD